MEVHWVIYVPQASNDLAPTSGCSMARSGDKMTKIAKHVTCRVCKLLPSHIQALRESDTKVIPFPRRD